jgi:hypothetical protein
VDEKQPRNVTDSSAAERAEQSEEQQEATEQAQADAAKERESERGYQ